MKDWDRNRLEATVQAAALCAYADGHLADDEREKLGECIAIHAANEEEARYLLGLVAELPEYSRTPQSGYRDSQFQEIKASLHPGAEREEAFYLAVQVANAHRGIGVEETSFLLNLMVELEIEAEFAQEVLGQARAKRRLPESAG